jgi:hypothetical protein
MSDSGGAAALGIFRQPEEVAQALDALRRAGLTGRQMSVLSDSPYPEGAFGEDPVHHRLYVYPFVGAAGGFAIGLLLTIGTQLSYPLVTGGKPILAIPPMINVMYEGTLLGAIVATVLGVLFESRLPDLRDIPYDRRISEGYLGVLVVQPGERFAAAEQALLDAGAIEVITNNEERKTKN